MTKDNKSKKNSSRNEIFIKGMAVGTILVLVAESTAFILSKDAIRNIVSGKAISTESLSEAFDEYETLQETYEYYLKGGKESYYIGDFDYPTLETEYYNVKSAGIKTYLKNCLDKKIIEYARDDKQFNHINFQDIYEDALWEIISSSPNNGLNEHQKLLIEEYLDEFYGFPIGTELSDYHNLELTDSEEKAVEFIKR